MVEQDLENLIPLRVAARTFRGGPLHVSTLHRYRQHGIGNVRLECVRVGGRWYTSAAAIDRFISALNPTNAAASLASRAASNNEAQIEADENLRRSGFDAG